MKRIGIRKGDEQRRKFVYDDTEVCLSSPPKYRVEFYDPKLGVSYIPCDEVELVMDNVKYKENEATCNDVFEYRVFDYHHRGENDLDELLNRFGALGYEMVSFNIYKESEHSNNLRLFTIFKRRVSKK